MTDHPIPDDLDRRIRKWLGSLDRYAGVPDHVSDMFIEMGFANVLGLLALLSEWADGHLLDPDGWRRVKAEEVAERTHVDGSWWYGDDECRLAADLDRQCLYTLTPAPEEETDD